MSKWMQPTPVSDRDVSLPANVSRLMPAYNDIPEAFTDFYNPYHRLAADWFYIGLEKTKLRAKPGIDARVAYRHLHTVISSFEPKHEHKMAAVAYLMSLWFDIA